MTMPAIFKVKIGKYFAGTKIPFDVIYLFAKDQQPLIPKLWRFALVMPFEQSFKDAVFKLPLHKISYLKQYRDDNLVNLETSPDIKTASKRNPSKTVVADIAKTWSNFQEYDLADRVVVVPMLMTVKNEELLPRYITSKLWFGLPSGASWRDRRRLKVQQNAGYYNTMTPPPSVLPDLAYLSTPYPAPNDTIRPICGICPRSLQHLQGRCVPGMSVCYESLNLNLQATPTLETEPDAEIKDGGIPQ